MQPVGTHCGLALCGKVPGSAKAPGGNEIAVRLLLNTMFPSADARYNDWVRSHYRFLMRSAWALTGSRAVAEDVVQDCFTLAWEHRRQLRDPALARAWLFRIMRRCVLRHVVPTAAGGADESPADEAAPDAGLDDRLDIVRALARLAPIHREVLVLHYFDDMSTALMAEALEVAPGTVLSRLARARDALRAAIAPPPRAQPSATVTVLRKA